VNHSQNQDNQWGCQNSNGKEKTRAHCSACVSGDCRRKLKKKKRKRIERRVNQLKKGIKYVEVQHSVFVKKSPL
jgi:hypothetical protein